MGHEALIWIKHETNGVKAWDTLMKHIDTRVINPGASRTGDLTKLAAIKLTSIARGSYANFIQLFEKTAAHIKINKKPLKDELKYNFLISAISHDDYSNLMTSIRTQIPPFTYAEVQNKLLIHAEVIEKKSLGNNLVTTFKIKVKSTY